MSPEERRAKIEQRKKQAAAAGTLTGPVRSPRTTPTARPGWSGENSSKELLQGRRPANERSTSTQRGNGWSQDSSGRLTIDVTGGRTAPKPTSRPASKPAPKSSASAGGSMADWAKKEAAKLKAAQVARKKGSTSGGAASADKPSAKKSRPKSRSNAGGFTDQMGISNLVKTSTSEKTTKSKPKKTSKPAPKKKK